MLERNYKRIWEKSSMNGNLKKNIFKGVGLAMGIGTLVLNIINPIDVKTAINLLSIGVISLVMAEFEK